jgi:hypothetical protein
MRYPPLHQPFIRTMFPKTNTGEIHRDTQHQWIFLTRLWWYRIQLYIISWWILVLYISSLHIQGRYDYRDQGIHKQLFIVLGVDFFIETEFSVQLLSPLDALAAKSSHSFRVFMCVQATGFNNKCVAALKRFDNGIDYILKQCSKYIGFEEESGNNNNNTKKYQHINIIVAIVSIFAAIDFNTYKSNDLDRYPPRAGYRGWQGLEIELDRLRLKDTYREAQPEGRQFTFMGRYYAYTRTMLFMCRHWFSRWQRTCNSPTQIESTPVVGLSIYRERENKALIIRKHDYN